MTQTPREASAQAKPCSAMREITALAAGRAGLPHAEPRLVRFGATYGRFRVPKAVAVSSRTDTVPRGGWLDGAHCVAYALEMPRARRVPEFRGAGRTMLVPVEARLRNLLSTSGGAVKLEAMTRIAHAPRWPRPASSMGQAVRRKAERCLSAVMLFVPSVAGRSHDMTEDTAERDMIHGCKVLDDAVGLALGALA